MSPERTGRGRPQVARPGRGLAATVGILAGMVAPAGAFEFSADRVLKDGGTVVAARVNARDDRWRLEYEVPQGGAMAVIVRADRRLSWRIMSQRRVYMEAPIAAQDRLLVEETLEGEVKRELIGREELNGHACELFEVTTMRENQPRHFYQWVTSRERFAVRTVSKEEGWSLEYRHLRFISQGDRLFEPPYGFSSDKPLASGKPEASAK